MIKKDHFVPSKVLALKIVRVFGVPKINLNRPKGSKEQKTML